MNFGYEMACHSQNRPHLQARKAHLSPRNPLGMIANQDPVLL
jgi:hypothetical protein